MTNEERRQAFNEDFKELLEVHGLEMIVYWNLKEIDLFHETDGGVGAFTSPNSTSGTITEFGTYIP